MSEDRKYNTPERSDSGDTSEDRREALLAEFETSAVEIEDLIKSCMVEYHLSVKSYEVKTLIIEWKDLYFQIFGVTVTEDYFENSEIGRFIAKHAAFEEISKLI